jgi:CRISPR-associated protein Cas5d
LRAEVSPYRKKSDLPEKAHNGDKNTASPGRAYQVIFNRRLSRGQCYSVPVLGWREFTPSYFGEFRKSTHVLEDMPAIIIPSMLKQVFSDGYNSKIRACSKTSVLEQALK